MTRSADEERPPPTDCVASVVAVTVTVYTPRRDYVDDLIATQDVRAAINAAAAHDFPGVAAVRLTTAIAAPDTSVG